MQQPANANILQEEILPGDAVEPVIKKPVRLQSLDALRGFDMFWIVSGEFVFHALGNVVMEKHSLVRNPENYQIATTFNLSFWERIAVGISNQLHHSPWNGFMFYDLIFPLFIFIAGISMPYSYSKRLSTDAVENRSRRKAIYVALIRRTIILLFLGMVVNGLFKWQGYEATRFASVLGRIALACFGAAIIYLNANRRAQIAWFIGILLGYWAMMVLIPVPGFGAGVLTPEGNLAAYVDRLFLPGKIHRKVYDPEGILSTLPSVCTALLGVFTGEFLRRNTERLTVLYKGLVLIAGSIALLGVALLWNLVFPINKNTWTSSFVLYAGGWSMLLFALFYLVIDVAGFKKWSIPFIWIGANSILIYLAAHGAINFESTAQFVFGGLIQMTTPIWQPVWLAVGVMVVQVVLLGFLYKKKWFLKV